jgi:hypothetical protein
LSLSFAADYIWVVEDIWKYLPNRRDVVVLLIQIISIEATIQGVCLIKHSFDELTVVLGVDHV